MDTTASTPRPRLPPWIALGAVLLLVYVPAWGSGWLNWDDPRIISDPLLQEGVGSAVYGAFFSAWDRAWYPVTRLTFAALHGLGALHPYVVHALDLTLFVGSAWGLLRVLPRMGVPASWAWPAMVLWALHPHRVEAVAWASSTKDMLSLAGVVATAWLLWPPGGGRPSTGQVVAAHVAWMVALGAKSAVFPLAGVAWVHVATREGFTVATRRTGGLLALALIDGLIARVAFEAGTVPPWPDALPTVLLPLYSLGMWTGGLLAPVGLAAVYPIADRWPAWVALGGVGVVVPLSAAVWHTRETGTRGSWSLVALWLLPPLPVMGLVPLAFWSADRYTLYPSLALTIAMVGVAMRWVPPSRWRTGAFVTLAAGLALTSHVRARDWQSSLSLWEADARRPGVHFARSANLGSALGGEGRFADALAAYQQAEALRPDRLDMRAHRMFAQVVVGGWNPARQEAGMRLEPPPTTAPDWGMAAVALNEIGEQDLAREAITTAAELGAPPQMIEALRAAVQAPPGATE